MNALSELRNKYPQYNDLSDQELADKYHAKYYSDIPKDEYYEKIGLSNAPGNMQNPESSITEDISHAMVGAIPEIAQGIMQIPGEIKGALSNPLQTLKNIPIGLAEGAAGAFNLPGNITGYLAEKGYFPESLARYAPHIPIQQIEERLGIEAKEPGEALTRGITGFGVLGKVGKFGEASKLKRAGLGAAYAGGMEQNPLAGAMAALIPNMVKGMGKGIEYLREPTKSLMNAERAINDINSTIKSNALLGETQKANINRYINEAQEALTHGENSFRSSLPEIFPIRPKSETRKNLSTASSNAIENLTQDFNARYSEFGQDFGRMPIDEPFNTGDIRLNGLQNVSHTTRNMAYNVANDVIDYIDESGNTRTITFPADHASVQDYIDFSRQLRDAAWDASRAAKNAAHGDKLQLQNTSRTLRRLQGEAEQKIRETVGEEAYQSFRNIQEDYSNLMGPVKTEPALFNAAFKEKISDKLHDALLQPANENIREYLYQDPEFRNALREHLMQGTRHPLTHGAQLNPASVNQDIVRLLTDQQRNALLEANRFRMSQDYLDDVSRNIKSPEALTARQEQQLRGASPEINEYITNLLNRMDTKSGLEHAKFELESEKQRLKHKKYKRYATAGAVGLAGTALLPGNPVTKLLKYMLKGG